MLKIAFHKWLNPLTRYYTYLNASTGMHSRKICNTKYLGRN